MNDMVGRQGRWGRAKKAERGSHRPPPVGLFDVYLQRVGTSPLERVNWGLKQLSRDLAQLTEGEQIDLRRELAMAAYRNTMDAGEAAPAEPRQYVARLGALVTGLLAGEDPDLGPAAAVRNPITGHVSIRLRRDESASLVDRAVREFIEALLQLIGIARCPVDDQLFALTRKGQKYCSSQCQITINLRRYRAKKKRQRSKPTRGER